MLFSVFQTSRYSEVPPEGRSEIPQEVLSDFSPGVAPGIQRNPV